MSVLECHAKDHNLDGQVRANASKVDAFQLNLQMSGFNVLAPEIW